MVFCGVDRIPNLRYKKLEINTVHDQGMNMSTSTELLNQARNARDNGSHKRSTELLVELVQNFPNSEEAETARQVLGDRKVPTAKNRFASLSILIFLLYFIGSCVLLVGFVGGFLGMLLTNIVFGLGILLSSCFSALLIFSSAGVIEVLLAIETNTRK